MEEITQVCKECGMKINKKKTKTVVICGTPKKVKVRLDKKR